MFAKIVLEQICVFRRSNLLEKVAPEWEFAFNIV